VMELVDVPDSKSGAARRGGSSPPRGTIFGYLDEADGPPPNPPFAMIVGTLCFAQ